MAFRSPASQAIKMMKKLQVAHKADGSKVIASVGTVRNYEQGLQRAAEWLKETHNGQLHHLTQELAKAFLLDRSTQVGQKALDMERQSIQCMLRFGIPNNQFNEKDKLEVIKSEHQQILTSRAYTQNQVDYIAQHQAPHNALATQIAADAGLRAHELHTLQWIEERMPDKRVANAQKFSGHAGRAYTVAGKKAFR